MNLFIVRLPMWLGLTGVLWPMHVACNSNDPVTSTSVVVTHSVAGIVVDVYLPPGYDSTRLYPLVLINDGSLALGASGFGLEDVLDEEIAEGKIRPVIAVGLTPPGDRNSNYLPYDDPWIQQNWGTYVPSAAEHARTVVDSVLPFLQKIYALEPTRDGRAWFGFSLGGLHATWAAIEHEDAFSKIGVTEPSFWADNYAIFQRTLDIQQPMQIWLDIGTRQWQYYVPFQERLLDAGWPYGESLWYYEVKDGAHTTSDWKMRIRLAFRALFGLTDASIDRIDVDLEVIPSHSQPGVFFQRINPVVTCRNGLKYSLASAASYQVLDASAGTLQRDGRFSFLSTKDIPVRITYQGRKVEYTIRYSKVQSMKKGN